MELDADFDRYFTGFNEITVRPIRMATFADLGSTKVAQRNKRMKHFEKKTPDIKVFLNETGEELCRAMTKHNPMNSAHEAYAVILEELDEFWDEVRKKRSERSPKDCYNELVQVAAMAARAAVELFPEGAP